MQIVPLEQNTPEWLEWRKGKATASQAAIIMGAAPNYWQVRTWEDLALEHAGLSESPDAQTQIMFDHGHRKELEARSELTLPEKFVPVCGESDADPKMTASLDGYYIAHDGQVMWTEIKCPYKNVKSKTWQMAAADHLPLRERIPEHYWWQLVHQAGVIGDKHASCYYLVYIDDTLYRNIQIPAWTLLRDWPTLKAEWERFLRGDSQGRHDLVWLEATREWQERKINYSVAKAELEAAKERVIELSTNGLGPIGCGVEVQTVERKGRIDWERVAATLYEGENLRRWADGFRNNPTTSITVRTYRE